MLESIPTISEHTSDYDDSELTWVKAGVDAATVLTGIMRGTDPEQLLASLIAGTGMDDAIGLAGIRSHIAQVYLQRLEAIVDKNGKTPIDNFQEALGRAIAEHLVTGQRSSLKRQLVYRTTLIEDLNRDTLDDEEKLWVQKDLERLDAAPVQTSEAIFVTDYHGVEGYESVQNNALLVNTLEQVSKNAMGEFDEKIFDALNGLLPNKAWLSVRSDGVIALAINGHELSTADTSS